MDKVRKKTLLLPVATDEQIARLSERERRTQAEMTRILIALGICAREKRRRLLERRDEPDGTLLLFPSRWDS